MTAVATPIIRKKVKPATESYWLITGPPGGPVAHVYLECSPRGVASVELAIDHLPLGDSLGRRAERPAISEDHRFAKTHPWAGELVAALRSYLQGRVVSFASFPVDLTGQPGFRRRVLEECRRIPYGQTVTYAELAERAGNLGAIRAAASAMSHNPIPLIIPCHRVLRSDGTLGGYSAPGGVSVKAQLIEMEKNALRATAN